MDDIEVAPPSSTPSSMSEFFEDARSAPYDDRRQSQQPDRWEEIVF